MANNLFANIPACVVAKTAISIASVSAINSSSIGKIFQAGSPIKSFVPGSGFNTLTAFQVGGGYWIEPLQDLDLTAYLIPPIPSSTDTTPPVIASAGTQNTNIVALYMSESVGTTSTAGHTVKVAGSAVAISSAIVSAGSQIIITLGVTILAGQTITYSYDPGTGNTLDIAGNELQAVTDYAVTNNVGGSNNFTVDGVALTVNGSSLTVN